jgi:hypothetical protein
MKNEVYDTCKELYGAKNLLTLHALNNLAYTYGITEGYAKKAMDLKKESYRLHAETLNSDHPRTLVVCANYAYSLMTNGHKEEAFELAKKYRGLCEKKLGENHISTDTMNRIYKIYKGSL